VGEHDRVLVHVDDPGIGRRGLGDLMGVVRGGDTGADVQELPDAGLGGQVTDGAGQEGPVGPDREDDIGIGRNGLIARGPVGREVIGAAKPVVVHPGDVGHADVKGRLPGRSGRGAAGICGPGRWAFAGHWFAPFLRQVSRMISLMKRMVPTGVRASALRRFMTSM